MKESMKGEIFADDEVPPTIVGADLVEVVNFSPKRKRMA